MQIPHSWVLVLSPLLSVTIIILIKLNLILINMPKYVFDAKIKGHLAHSRQNGHCPFVLLFFLNLKELNSNCISQDDTISLC